jgi:hypothetical protein
MSDEKISLSLRCYAAIEMEAEAYLLYKKAVVVPSLRV